MEVVVEVVTAVAALLAVVTIAGVAAGLVC
jgi:hypothetical protein